MNSWITNVLLLIISRHSSHKSWVYEAGKLACIKFIFVVCDVVHGRPERTVPEKRRLVPFTPSVAGNVRRAAQARHPLGQGVHLARSGEQDRRVPRRRPARRPVPRVLDRRSHDVRGVDSTELDRCSEVYRHLGPVGVAVYVVSAQKDMERLVLDRSFPWM